MSATETTNRVTLVRSFELPLAEGWDGRTLDVRSSHAACRRRSPTRPSSAPPRMFLPGTFQAASAPGRDKVWLNVEATRAGPARSAGRSSSTITRTGAWGVRHRRGPRRRQGAPARQQRVPVRHLARVRRARLEARQRRRPAATRAARQGRALPLPGVPRRVRARRPRGARRRGRARAGARAAPRPRTLERRRRALAALGSRRSPGPRRRRRRDGSRRGSPTSSTSGRRWSAAARATRRRPTARCWCSSPTAR